MPGRGKGHGTKRKRRDGDDGAAAAENLCRHVDFEALVAELDEVGLSAAAPAPIADAAPTEGDSESVAAMAAEWHRCRISDGFNSPRALLPLTQPAPFRSLVHAASALAAASGPPDWGEWSLVSAVCCSGLRTLSEIVLTHKERCEVDVAAAALCRYVHSCCAVGKVAAKRVDGDTSVVHLTLTTLLQALSSAALCPSDAYKHAFSSCRALSLACLRAKPPSPARTALLDRCGELWLHPFFVGEECRVRPQTLTLLRGDAAAQLCHVAAFDDAAAAHVAGLLKRAHDGGEAGRMGAHAAAVRAASAASGLSAAEDDEDLAARHAPAEAAEQCGGLSLLQAMPEHLPTCAAPQLPAVVAAMRSPHGAVRKAAVGAAAAVVARLGPSATPLAMAVAERLAALCMDRDANVANRAVQELVRVGSSHVWSPDTFVCAADAVRSCLVSQHSRVRLSAARALAPLLVRNPLTSTFDLQQLEADAAALSAAGQGQSDASRSLRAAAGFVTGTVAPLLEALETALVYLSTRSRLGDLDSAFFEAAAGTLAGDADDAAAREMLLSLPADPAALLSLLPDGAAAPDSPQRSAEALVSRVFRAKYFTGGGSAEDFRVWEKRLRLCAAPDAALRRLCRVTAAMGIGRERLSEASSAVAAELSAAGGELLHDAGTLLLLGQIDPQVLVPVAGAPRRVLERCLSEPGSPIRAALELAALAQEASGKSPYAGLVRHEGMRAAVVQHPQVALRFIQSCGVDPRVIAYPTMLALEAGAQDEVDAAGLLGVLRAAADVCRRLWTEQALRKWDEQQKEAAADGDADDASSNAEDDDRYMRDSVVRRNRDEFAQRYSAMLFGEGFLSRYVPFAVAAAASAASHRVRVLAYAALPAIAAFRPGVAAEAAAGLEKRAADLRHDLETGAGDREANAAELCALCDCVCGLSTAVRATSASEWMLSVLCGVMLWSGDDGGCDSDSDSSSGSSDAGGGAAPARVADHIERPRVRAAAAMGDMVAAGRVANPARTVAAIARCMLSSSAAVAAVATRSVRGHLRSAAQPGPSLLQLFRALPPAQRGAVTRRIAQTVAQDPQQQWARSCAGALAAAAAEHSPALFGSAGSARSASAAALGDLLGCLKELPVTESVIAALSGALQPLSRGGEAGDGLRRDARGMLPASAWADLRVIVSSAKAAAEGRTAKQAAKVETLHAVLQHMAAPAEHAQPQKKKKGAKTRGASALVDYESMLDRIVSAKASSALPAIAVP